MTAGGRARVQAAVAPHGRRRRWLRIGVLVAVTTIAAGVAVRLIGWGPPEWLFLSVLGSIAAVTLLYVVLGWTGARRARRHARDLAAVSPSEVALAAVEAERIRLAADIGDGLRRAVTSVIEESEAASQAADPRPALRRIHHTAQLATSELRRQLGLLRTSPEPDPMEGSAPVVGRSGNLGWLGLAAGMAGVVLLETWAYPSPDPGVTTMSPTSVVLSVIIAVTPALAVASRGWAAAAAGLLFAVGLAASTPVVQGFWMLGLGVLCHACLADPMSRRSTAGAAVLIAGAGVSTAAFHPDNASLLVILLVGAATTGWFRSRTRNRTERARAEACRTADQLQAATRRAVTEQREDFAREIHDVVSHGIGVMAVQAAAAELSWPEDPAAARCAFDVIRRTGKATLAELERLPGAQQPPRSLAELTVLTDRIRAAGTPVRLRLPDDDVPTDIAETAYRTVQEALTNVVRHAPGAAAEVDLTVGIAPDGSRQLIVRVVDDGPGLSTEAPRGYGLVGLSERVRLAHGTLTLGPAADRGRSAAGSAPGFVVAATLPWPASATVEAG